MFGRLPFSRDGDLFPDVMANTYMEYLTALSGTSAAMEQVWRGWRVDNVYIASKTMTAGLTKKLMLHSR